MPIRLFLALSQALLEFFGILLLQVLIDDGMKGSYSEDSFNVRL